MSPTDSEPYKGRQGPGVGSAGNLTLSPATITLVCIVEPISCNEQADDCLNPLPNSNEFNDANEHIIDSE